MVTNMVSVLQGIVIGVCAGILSGMFGIGGGILIVPALVLALGFNQHKAQGTSLTALCMPVLILGAMNYWKEKQFDLHAAIGIGVGMLAGAFIGSKFVLNLDPVTTRKSFAVFLMIVAVYTFFKK